jgi:hypothetical protein
VKGDVKMDDEKVLDRRVDAEYEGEFADIIAATHRVAEIICTASQLTNENAKKSLFAGVKEILSDCITAIDSRIAENTEPVMEDD